MSSADLKARSPWSTLNNVQSVSLSPPETHSIDGEISIPGSKSLTNRALILAALANGTSTLSGILKSDDSYWCIDALNRLGIKTEVEGDMITVHGNNAVWPNDNTDLYIGAAGTIARFLPGALAVAKKGSWVIEASNRMSERPVKPLIDALTEMGAAIDYLDKDGYFPLRITA
ncbi:3-phosphoshikimate 1-carboxyvinyltransferase [Sporosarcina limicola]|uniref:5-enolpyruvylshikimate-3-phosphate synthase n=1 Tax=Sporosarcina limicola TaxID=34101 RepID=A0A927RGS6_9BACL|nr:hypothetical protein [Sporosarcina limicola]MBE1556787.1 5-enolpyruvylshikimate-3-phosphate synthase [Sporosarcina limicola]